MGEGEKNYDRESPPLPFSPAPTLEPSMRHLKSQITEASEGIRSRWSERPRCGIILGSGLGSVGEAIELDTAIDYGEIPHFLKSTAVGHKGRLLCGRLAGVPVVAMQGRFHCYEGYSAERATFPVRLMNALGIELLIVSNAAGGLNPNFACGDVMVIDDHINLLNRNPLVGVNDDQLGPRFPDMGAPYDRRLGDRALAIAREARFRLPPRCVRRDARPNVRNPRRNSHAPLLRRRRRRHVDRPRSNRGDARQPPRPGPLDNHQHLLAR